MGTDESNPGPMPDPRVEAAVLASGGFVSSALCAWLVARAKRLLRVHYIEVPDVTCARNAAIAKFLAGDADVLLMVHHDIQPEAAFAGPWEMGDRDIMTARYAGPKGEYHSNNYSPACMSVRRGAVSRMPPPWFTPPVLDAGGTRWLTCDCAGFFAKAKAMGMKLGRWEQGVGHRHMHDFPPPGDDHAERP